MAKPILHAESAAKKYGGNASDYMSIENMMDSSKSSFGDNRHRAIFHHIFGTFVMEQMFGINYEKLEGLMKKYNLPEEFIKDYENQREIDREKGTQLRNSDNKKFSVRDIAELHCLEDFRMKFIPSIQDYLENMEMKSWMQNGLGTPPSAQKLYKEKKPTLTEQLDVILEENKKTETVSYPGKDSAVTPKSENIPGVDNHMEYDFSNAVMDGNSIHRHDFDYPHVEINIPLNVKEELTKIFEENNKKEPEKAVGKTPYSD